MTDENGNLNEKSERTNAALATPEKELPSSLTSASASGPTTKNDATSSSDSTESSDMILGIIPFDNIEPYLIYVKGIAGILLAFFLVAPGHFIWTLWNLIWTILGVTVGVGLGAGLALHIFHQLQTWQHAFDKERRNKNRNETDARKHNSLDQSKRRTSLVRDSHVFPSSSVSSSIGAGGSNSSLLEDGNSYLSLMARAGYSIPDRVLRGQVLREDNNFWTVMYKFTDDKIPQQRGVRLVSEDWPALPEPVTKEMGRFIEHVMRDYISGWYSILDNGVTYRNEEDKRAEGVPRDGGGDGETKMQELDSSENMTQTGQLLSTSKRESSNEQDKIGSAKGDRAESLNVDSSSFSMPIISSEGQQYYHQRVARKMVYSTLTHRRVPMIDCTYRVLSSTFGNLATRAEHVNVMELLLLKWTQVIGHTFKIYRNLYKLAAKKNESHGIFERSPSEIEVTREYLLAGKLHRAITFGLDVPSLLFADASGEECGCGTSSDPKNPTQVLEQRLYHTAIIKECELDYLRVVAHRLIRALLPKTEASSQCVMALVVEIFAGCVLQPLMNLWVPSFINDLIVKAMTKPNSENENNSTSIEGSEKTLNVADIAMAELEAIALVTQSLSDSNAAKEDNEEERLKHGSELQEEQVSAGNEMIAGLNEAEEDTSAEDNNMKDTSVDLFATPVRPSQRERAVSSASSENDGSLDHLSAGNKDCSETSGSKLLMLSAMALAELAKFVDFEECRNARLNNLETSADWDDPDCQSSVLRLVMVIEAALLDGRCAYRIPLKHDQPLTPNGDSIGEIDAGTLEIDDGGLTKMEEERESFVQLLMEMTSDMDGFEKRIHEEGVESDSLSIPNDHIFEPDANEISTIRTLISTWLHTGQLYKALSLIFKAADTVFAPFYVDDALLVLQNERESFLTEMKVLDGVDVMVETMAVLASQRLDITDEFELLSSFLAPASHGKPSNGTPIQLSLLGSPKEGIARDLAADFGNRDTPRFLDFQRNSAFAASMRAERERRLRAWHTRQVDESVQTVIRKSATKKIDFELHTELHNLARLFYNGTSIITIRDAARKGDNDEEAGTSDAKEKVSLLTVEMASNRRRIEVPDDDSSFLLRAQARPLNPVSVHRDDRNHELSYKCYLSTYEEPAIAPGSTRYSGGRFIRRCFLQYYPSDRTATVVLQGEPRKLDKRKGGTDSEQILIDQNTTPYVSGAFLRQRHLCQKWSHKGGVGSQSFLSSALMESGDFNATPRTGKALDFVYRMSLFEKPVVDLASKRFTIQDSSSRGVHRADASAMEMSDASLSYVLLHVGKDSKAQESSDTKHKVEMGPDGYPMIFLRLTNKKGEQVSTEIKPYRMSFVRAALLVTSSRQEAQLQSLIDCVKAGSAKSATKMRTEEQLRPTLKIMDFANDKSKDQAKASCLNRDLKLGVYHIDREQLRRNGLLSLRHPTSLMQLSAKVEGTASAKDVPLAKILNNKLLPDETLYSIRCTAVVELDDTEEFMIELEPYSLDDGSYAAFYREEWIVYRSMKDFQALHKQLKSQVSTTESSMSTGTRIVGAATAALSSRNTGRRNKKILIPSLAQASKIGGMGVTKRSIAKRMDVLDEYLTYLLSSNSLMSRCSELLLFLGASHPFPPEVTVTKTPANFMDPLGRMSFVRSIALKDSEDVMKLKKKYSLRSAVTKKPSHRISLARSRKSFKRETSKNNEASTSDIVDMDPAIASKVDQVPLAEVRNRIVELMRYSFGFENASFVRSQMLSALETASFFAIAKQSDFRRVLHDLHSQHLNGDAIGGWIRMLLDLLWPDGVWGKAAPVLTEAEEAALKEESRRKLHEGFPEKFRAILGKELTKDGLDMIHDMMQNRMVIKSMFYMLLDILWIEIFPELRDTLPCASALDLDIL